MKENDNSIVKIVGVHPIFKRSQDFYFMSKRESLTYLQRILCLKKKICLEGSTGTQSSVIMEE